MRLISSGKYIEAIPQTSKEISQMEKFPGFFRSGPRYFAVKKTLVVQNLAKRLKAHFGALDVDREVFSIAKGSLKLKDIPEDFVFHTTPLTPQMIALRFLYTLESAGLLLEPGMGKTKIYLDYIFLMKFRRSLVVCPMALLGTWEDEVAVHRPELNVYLVRTTNWAEELPKMKEADLVVINYDKAVRLYEGLSTEIQFDSMNIDEGLIKSPTTARTKCLTAIGQEVKHKVINSGTLINNSPLDLFAPVRYLEPSLVGRDYKVFKELYAIESKKGKDASGKPLRQFVVGYKNVEEMRDTLESCCIVMKKSEWLKDLPEKTFHIVDVKASEEQKRVFGELQSNFMALFQDRYVEVPSPLVLAAKQCQVANGFIYYTESKDILADDLDYFSEAQFSRIKKKEKLAVKRETLFFPEQPKLTELMRLLQVQMPERRVMVWYNSQAERVLIESEFNNVGLEFLTIAGGEKDTSGKVRLFNRDKKYKVLLCQAKAVNYGVTVLGHKEDHEVDVDTVFREVDSTVYTQIFYSLNFSLEVFLQQQDRVHRIGQKKACDYFILLTDFDIERYVYKVLGDKEDVKDTMMVDFVKSRKVDL
jgi:SNF2 family DNA or RNA helicase